jgi:DnaK suppressor protein
MTKTTLNVFRRALQKSLAELGKDTRNRAALAIDTSPDELDRIQHAAEREYAMNILERNSNRLRDVRTALGRILAGTFGICVDCEETINPKRLSAVPWALCCIACQETAEARTSRSEIDASLVMAA